MLCTYEINEIHQIQITMFAIFQELKDNVAQLCVDMHGTVAVAMTRFWDEMKRRCYITPSSYMELILTYSRMLKDQKTEFMTNRYVQECQIQDYLTFFTIEFGKLYRVHHSSTRYSVKYGCIQNFSRKMFFFFFINIESYGHL